MLVTGFLGAGKTTLLRRLLSAHETQRVGVLVNEFGAVGIDGALVARAGLVVQEVAGGSVFCSCVKAEFLTALIELSRRGLDTVFVEASGLSDPSNIGEILGVIAPRCERPFAYAGAVTVVDAETFVELTAVLPTLTRQVECADAVVVNKADLVPPPALTACLQQVAALAFDVPVLVATRCAVDAVALVASLAGPATSPRESLDTPEARPATFTVRVVDPVPSEALAAVLERVTAVAHRVKGFVPTDEGTVAVSAVGRRIEVTPWDGEPQPGRLVVISAVGIRALSVLTNAIDKHAKGAMRW